jgi:Cu+-exporting ATPase
MRMNNIEVTSASGHVDKDPVCGARIDPQAAAARDEYEGIVFHFCSHACHERFLARPEFYAARAVRSP